MTADESIDRQERMLRWNIGRCLGLIQDATKIATAGDLDVILEIVKSSRSLELNYESLMTILELRRVQKEL
jgi:hypothetical protein